jgi:hypothetical protein
LGVGATGLALPGVGMPGVGIAGLGAGRGAGVAAGTALAAGRGAGLGAGFAGATGAAAGGALLAESRNLRTTGASIVDDADLTNSPMSCSWVMSSLLSTPNSRASS